MKEQGRVPSDPSAILTALSVSPKKGDHLILRKVFERSNWALYETDCVVSALAILRRRDIGVILCERDLSLHSWLDMLDHLTALRGAPPLIVTSRLADDALWAQALYLGAYDVLAKPFDEQELIRVIGSAWQHFQQSRETRRGGKEKLLTAAAGWL